MDLALWIWSWGYNKLTGSRISYSDSMATLRSEENVQWKKSLKKLRQSQAITVESTSFSESPSLRRMGIPPKFNANYAEIQRYSSPRDWDHRFSVPPETRWLWRENKRVGNVGQAYTIFRGIFWKTVTLLLDIIRNNANIVHTPASHN